MKIKNPLLRPAALLLVGVSLSIGWGIRGNYGHETGAMFPGALAAIAACLLSGREDWRQRVAYFGLFGMLGWALGGSISYMHVIGYTQSGHAASQWFGFGALFVIGFLWAALGGAGTALPAVYSDPQLRSLFRPLSIVLLIWACLYLLEPRIAQWLEPLGATETAASGATRQTSRFYWLDSDWLAVSVMLAVLLIYDLVKRRCARAGTLLAYAAAGGLVCYLLFFALDRTTGNGWITQWLVQPQGLFEDRFQPDQLAVTNWPGVLLQIGQRPGLLYTGDRLALWGGALLGISVYFIRFGRFDDEAGLLVAMAVGWLLAFLLLPVLGSLLLPQHGGLRMTPPRGDNWAGVLGSLVGACCYFWRSGRRELILVALLCGTIGGIGFSGAAWLEGMFVSLGNRNLQAADADWQTWQETTWQPASWAAGERMPPPEFATGLETPPAWQHWQNQNWHSFLEQTYGFVNGLAVAIALSVLVTRLPHRDRPAADRRWLLLALVLLIPALAYVNLVKNVEFWTADHGGHISVPPTMQAPWIDFELSALGWFNLFFAVATLAYMGAIVRHFRRPIELWSGSWLARGELLYLVLLWVFVGGNMARALPDFAQGRLLTEGVILVNAILVSLLVLVVPRTIDEVPLREGASWGRSLGGALVLTLLMLAAVPSLEYWSLRRVYASAPSGQRGLDFRFGPNANWKREPLLRGVPHR